MTANHHRPEAIQRGARMLRTALGPSIARFLEDPAVVEATHKPFNPDDWDLRFMTPLRDEVLDRPAQRRGT